MITEIPWLVASGTNGAHTARVFCFAHAGGDPRRFLQWQPALATDAELVAVCPPGRGHRGADRAPDIDELIAGAAARIDALTEQDGRAIYLFGHSFGALLAFEVARRLRDRSELRHLVASGVAAPSLLPSARVSQLATLEGRAFAEALGFFGGLPPEILADEDLQELLLPGLIADFQLAASYRYQVARPLTVGVSLINGREDPHVGPAQLEPWRNECGDAPLYHWADGGHFYFERQPSVIVDVLRAVVAADQHIEMI